MSNESEDICSWSLTELSQAIHAKQVTSQLATQSIFERIAAKDPDINAYVHLYHEQAMEQAEQADREIEQGQSRGPMHGVPVAIKDIIETAQGPTTMASPIYKDH